MLASTAILSRYFFVFLKVLTHLTWFKLLLFTAHDVIEENHDKAGYLLLKANRKYINMIMYAELEIHTVDTIERGRNCIKQFSDALKVFCFIFFTVSLLTNYQQNYIPEA